MDLSSKNTVNKDMSHGSAAVIGFVAVLSGYSIGHILTHTNRMICEIPCNTTNDNGVETCIKFVMLSQLALFLIFSSITTSILCVRRSS